MSTKQSARLKNKRRPGDPWVSKNRVLNPTKAKRNCPIYRNPNFDTDETKLLIQLWGDPKVQRELITTHKKHVVIAQLAAKMEEYGYYRSPEEITTRIKNMKCFYNRLKKEMELNKNLDPSWRHYADMEAIMTRPIFSVRPNEVPAPSLKYLMEQEEEKRRERKRKAEEEGIDLSDSDDDIEDVLAVSVSRRSSKSKDKESECIEPDAEIELEVDDETLAALEKGGKSPDKAAKDSTNKNKNLTEMDDEMTIKMEIESEEFQTVDENNSPIKSKDTTNNDSELLIPKMEPISVDDESQSAEQTTPVIPASNSAPQLVGILNQPTKSQSGPSITFTKFSMPQNSMTNTIVTSTASTSSITPSKISVVSPTILMPQPSAQLTANAPQSPRPMRLGGNIQALLTASGPRQTVTASNGMKFILVNAADRRGPPLTTSTLPMPPPKNQTSPQQSVKVVQQQQQSPQQSTQSQPKVRPSKSQPTSVLKTNIHTGSTKKRLLDSLPDRDTLRRRELSGIKNTLQKLLKAKEDSNEIQSQQLAIERERLQFERTIADRFLAICEQNQKIQQQLLQQQQQQQNQAAQQRSATQQLFATTTNTTSNVLQQNQGQLMMPPKLLITTMVPTSAAGTTAGGNATLAPKVLKATNFKNLTSASASINVDKPLLIPKEEPNN